jgi:hypothetical protein
LNYHHFIFSGQVFLQEDYLTIAKVEIEISLSIAAEFVSLSFQSLRSSQIEAASLCENLLIYVGYISYENNVILKEDIKRSLLY